MPTSHQQLSLQSKQYPAAWTTVVMKLEPISPPKLFAPSSFISLLQGICSPKKSSHIFRYFQLSLSPSNHWCPFSILNDDWVLQSEGSSFNSFCLLNQSTLPHPFPFVIFITSSITSTINGRHLIPDSSILPLFSRYYSNKASSIRLTLQAPPSYQPESAFLPLRALTWHTLWEATIPTSTTSTIIHSLTLHETPMSLINLLHLPYHSLTCRPSICLKLLPITNDS